LGLDDAGDKIISILKSQRVRTSFLSRDKSYFTPVKTRILGGEDNTRKQQILRIDRESAVPETEGIRRRLGHALERTAPRCGALLVSDYNYMGVKVDLFDGVLPLFKKARIPVTVDSRFRLLSFAGATLATPNEPEVEEALKIEARGDGVVLDGAAQAIMKKCRLRALLITRGSNGMTLYERGQASFSIPVFGSKDIVDVTGAGDTVISVFTLAIAAGATFRQAARLANYAGGIVVMKKGAATLTPEELRQAVLLSP
jgi:rfaE bifunctional protein kinase chain/domain